jgi:DUF1680 family protein
VKAFPLSAVRLTGGPTQHAQRLGQRYLLGLEADRLLAPYLREAGLTPVRPSYGNWESAGLEGHTAGHYLSGLAKMYAATGDGELKQRLDHVVAVLARCQELIGTGYVGGIVDSARLWEQIRSGDVVSDSFGLNGRWVPLYNLHKVLAGLLDANRHAGSDLALDIALRLAEWWLDLVGGLSETQFQTMVATEFGGLNEVFADLGGSTGDPRYTAMAHRFTQPWLVAPLIAERDELDGLHANTQIAKIVGYQRLATVDRTATDLARASRFFWEAVAVHRSISIGGNSVREHFNRSSDFSSMVIDRQGPETCNTYNMLKLTTSLFLSDPRPEYLDYYERATFNHVLSSQHPEHGGLVYFTPIRPNHYRVYSDLHECFWCCVGTGLENHATYGELAYTHDDTDLYVNLFVPSRLIWPERGLAVRQRTDFPDAGRTELEIEAAPAGPVTLRLREPRWTGGQVAFAVNGVATAPDATGGYRSLRRIWRPGDRVSMEFAMPLRTVALPGGEWASFAAGPIVLAARDDDHPPPPTVADDSRMGHVARGPLAPQRDLPIVPALDGLDPVDVLLPTGEPLRFRLVGADLPHGSTPVLEPFFRLHDSRYTVYWPAAAPDRIAERRAALHRQDLEEAADLLLVDEVVAGEQQPESEHDYRGESATAGASGGRRWRSSDRWFGYTLRDSGGRARTARLSCQGAAESRRFGVEINAVTVAEIELPTQPDGTVHLVELTLPEEARRADGSWRVRLRAAPGSRTADLLRIQLLAGGDELEPAHHA